MPRFFYSPATVAAAALEQARLVGEFATIIENSRPSDKLTLAQAMRIAKLPVLLNQYRIHAADGPFGHAGITWAWMSEYTLSKVPLPSLYSIHMSEWNEGPHLCICSVHAKQETLEFVLKDFLDDVGRGEVEVWTYPISGEGGVDRMERYSTADIEPLLKSLSSKCLDV